MTTPSPDACRLCGGERHEALQVQKGFRIPCEGEQVPFDIQTELCTTCGAVATRPPPPADLLAAFYAGQERDAFIPDAERRVPGEGSRRDQAAWLEAELGCLQGLHVLEIGCYEGFLLQLLRERGAVVQGIEPSLRAATLGSQRWGVPIEAGRFEDAVLPEGQFDLIVLSHVLEHLLDPRDTLERCHGLLAPGGSLFVEVPNVLEPRVGSAVDFFTFDHLWNFSPAVLGALYRACGFEPGALADDFPFPAFRLLGSRVATTEPLRVPADTVDEVREVVRAYGRDRAEFVARLRRRIDDELPHWEAERSRVAIYGAGTHTQCLLDATALGRANLVALVDGNPAKQGTELYGLPVVSPEGLDALRPDAIVISSYDFQNEMVARLEGLGLGDLPRVTFYPRVQAFSAV